MGDGKASPERRSFVEGLVGSSGLGSKGISLADLSPVGAAFQANEARNPQEMSLAAIGMLPGAGAIERAVPKVERGIIAYHGSPHSFERFDISKIGTGEGAQAYGHGLYFADNEAVAKAYRDNLSGRNSPLSKAVFKGGKEINWYEMNADERKLLPILSDAGGDVSKAKEIVKSDYLPSAHDRLSAELDRLASQGYELRPHGSMYQVRINADPEQFLDWDKPLSEQGDAVKQAIDTIGKEYLGRPINYDRFPFAESGSGLHTYVTAASKQNEQSAAQALRGKGVPGIKYLDQGSRAAGDGSRNYVVFDDKLIDILRKYSLAGLGVGLPTFAAMQGQQPQQAPGL